MIAKVYSAIPSGYEGQLIEVEGNMSRGLPMFTIVGMANKTITEARERIRSALMSTNFKFPDQKLTINLAPAELTKTGSHLDLPIALAILALSGQVLSDDFAKRLFVGELSLDGTTKPVRGIINIVEAAKLAGFNEIYLPAANLEQASLVPGIRLYGVTDLTALILHLKGTQTIPEYQDTPVPEPATFGSATQKPAVPEPIALAPTAPAPESTTPEPTTPEPPAHEPTTPEPTTPKSTPPKPTASNPVTPSPGTASALLDHVHGQTLAKRALIIAIAGHHNILFSGPPGSGKTFLARVAANLLPPPSRDEQIAITKLHSLEAPLEQIISTRPFRAPHHTASIAALIGGGPNASPGEISLAHHGVLFLDEFPEFPRAVIESLRQPLEDHTISIARANHRVTYPANFMLIATMNPCPCGYYGDPSHPCTCTRNQILAYREKISGPVLDRIDMVINVDRVKNTDLLGCNPNYPEHTVATLAIANALARQHARYHSTSLTNGSLSSQQIASSLTLHPSAKTLLAEASERLALSARAYFKTIKVASTIADLADSPVIRAEHISEALSFREQLKI